MRCVYTKKKNIHTIYTANKSGEPTRVLSRYSYAGRNTLKKKAITNTIE